MKVVYTAYEVHLFFLYADIFPSQLEPLFGLPRGTLFVETRSTCFIGYKNTRVFKPIKTLLLVFQTLLKIYVRVRK